MIELARNYSKAVKENITPEQLIIKNVSKQDRKHYLKEKVDILRTSNIVQWLATNFAYCFI